MNEERGFSEEELDSYRYFHPYMYKRKLTDEIIELFDVGYDKDFVLKSKTTGNEMHLQCITFPVRDITGKTLFIARRCVNNKIFHYPEGVTKPLYGIYELYQLPEFPKTVYVCESIIASLFIFVNTTIIRILNSTLIIITFLLNILTITLRIISTSVFYIIRRIFVVFKLIIIKFFIIIIIL